MRRVFGPRRGDPVSFWSTKLGATIASVSILLFVGAVWFFGDIVVRLQPEMEEIRAELLSGDYLKRRFEFVANVDPVPRQHSRGRRLHDALSGDSRREWSVVQNADGVAGHFTFEVNGWRKLSDKRLAPRERIVVSFVKRADGSVTITKIDGLFMRYPVDPEWEKAMKLIGEIR